MYQSIQAILDDRANLNPNDIALCAIARSPLTYTQLRDRVHKGITFLQTLGIGYNDRVAIALPNGSEMAVAFLTAACGATCAPLNPNYREPEFEFYLEDLNAKALIVQAGVADAARTVAQKRGIPIIKLTPTPEAEAGVFELSISFSGSSELQESPSLPLSASPRPPVSPTPSPSHTALILHTSGTTSRPKIVPLTHRNLCTSANNIRTALNLTARDRCLNVMPLFHIHGLMGALLSSLSAGASVVCTPGFYSPKFFRWVEEFRPTWYSAVPTMHQQILARAEANREIIERCPIRLIRASSAPLPPQVMAALEQIFNAPVIESYGMTEASHQMASNPLPPKTRKPGSVGIAAGPEVAIMDEEGNLLSPGETREVVIRGENVTQGYENNPEANANAFTNGWFRTGDLGNLDEAGYLFLKGRIKEIINRGGEKISPREVDEVLLDFPEVEQVVTFAAPHKLLGEDVAAAVVLREGATVSEQALKEFAAERLSDFKIPRVILFLDEIPKGPTGKRQRIGLAEKLGLTASDPTVPRAEYAPPQTSVEKTLAQIWSEVLEVTPVGIHDNFFQLGGDSILAAQIVNRVRDALHIELSFLIFFQQPTVARMAENITQLQAETVDSDELDAMLAEIESLSEEDAEELLK
ncbi:AMP-binding protein [Lusitaniella coriacea LEGE 07157]|uniref:AMP-binding protein n=1 Tax=Lusitaniella coriacea LEGE 07157 TaxID=945747 RepID=A0A8J7B8V2_9CYAN|nr:AMP-binding protein [Lusitaniella coriacea]MBE9115228.1 AMP-binding protein [Lusitaniella coriacea LEGE 07157]